MSFSTAVQGRRQCPRSLGAQGRHGRPPPSAAGGRGAGRGVAGRPGGRAGQRPGAGAPHGPPHPPLPPLLVSFVSTAE